MYTHPPPAEHRQASTRTIAARARNQPVANRCWPGLIGAVLLLTLGVPVSAQIATEIEAVTPIESLRGFRANEPFLTAEGIESINPSNGNLILSVPLGQTYSVGPLLSYRLQVTHNADVWDHVRVDCQDVNDPGVCTVIDPFHFSLPNFNSNAGIGWELHLGKLYPPVPPADAYWTEKETWPNRDPNSADALERWLYVSPDGASHYLHRLDGWPGDTQGARYSKDGTHLRMVQVSSSLIEIQQPNGVVSRFLKTNESAGTEVCGPGRATGCWRFHDMLDGYGNFVRAAYQIIGAEEIWTISDSTGRSHRIVFALDAATVGRFDATPNQVRNGEGSQMGDLSRVVKRVEVAAFGGQIATYSFHTAVRRMSRGCPNNTDTNGNVVFHPDNFTIDVPVLDRIDFPEGQGFVFVTDAAVSAGCADGNGLIRSVVAPTQGKTVYTYGNWAFPTRCTYGSNPDAELVTHRLGLLQKDVYAINAATPESTWKYRSSLVGNPEPSGQFCARFDYRASWVDEPVHEGRFTRRYFYTNLYEGPQHPSATTPITDQQVTDYGLPYRKDIRVNPHGTDKFLSEMLLDCPQGGGACTLKQRTYVRYEMGFRPCTRTKFDIVDGSDCYRVNPVRAAELVVYHDGDSGKHVERTLLGYDGAGNLATSMVRDNFETSGVRTVRTDTDYTTTGMSFAADPSTGYFDVGTPSTYLPATTARWVLARFDERRVTDSGRTYITEFELDAQGQITCSRRWKRLIGAGSPTALRGSQDLVTKLSRNAQGLVTTETVAGGDQASLSNAVLCSVVGSASAGTRFDTTHTYQHLTLASSRMGTFPYSFRATIDRNTGLPSAVFDPSDQRTDLQFDRLGRIGRATPEASLAQAYTTVTYFNDPGTSARVDLQVFDPTTNGQRQRLRFWRDHRGRIFQEGSWVPTTTVTGPVEETLVKRTFDAAGNLARVTTKQPTAGHDIDKAVRYSGYDVFGRPTTITHPDASVETLTSAGHRVTTRRVSVRTSETAFSTVTTETHFDGLGRAIRQVNPHFTLLTTYDPLGNVVAAVRTAGAASQTRSYGWDGRGLLTFEDHPEIGAPSAVFGRISYQRDALGNPRWVLDGQRWLEHLYDAAGRPTTIREGSTPWQTFVWGTANATGDVRKGKLVQSTRYNYPGGDTWAFVEDYTYGGALGRISERSLQLEHPNRTGPDRYGARFTQRYVYDALGNRISMTYPFCVTAPQTGQRYCNDPSDIQGPSHVVDLTHRYGHQTVTASRLGPRADLIFHGNSQLATATYGNATQDLFDQGSAGMVRPARIRTQRTSSGTIHFDTGLFQFDAAGNIWAAGTDRYAYDSAGRLLSGTVKRAGSTRREDFRYDAFDNLTGYRKDGSSVWQNLVADGKNRLVWAAGEDQIVYDSAGRLTHRGTFVQSPFTRESDFTYDALGMQTRHTVVDAAGNPLEDYLYFYGPGNYRVMVFEGATGKRHWKLRDLDGKPLRELWVWQWGAYQSPGAPGEKWTFDRDYLYGPNGMFATYGLGGIVRYFHRDHVGSTRVITDASANKVYEAAFYPYGDELKLLGSLGEDASKFTGHERDRSGTTDYMLGRTYGSDLHRFMSADPARDGWNLYGYVGGNPIRFVDPNGLECTAAQDTEDGGTKCRERTTTIGPATEELVPVPPPTYDPSQACGALGCVTLGFGRVGIKGLAEAGMSSRVVSTSALRDSDGRPFQEVTEDTVSAQFILGLSLTTQVQTTRSDGQQRVEEQITGASFSIGPLSIPIYGFDSLGDVSLGTSVGLGFVTGDYSISFGDIYNLIKSSPGGVRP